MKVREDSSLAKCQTHAIGAGTGVITDIERFCPDFSGARSRAWLNESLHPPRLKAGDDGKAFQPDVNGQKTGTVKALLMADNAVDLRCAQWVITHGSAKRGDAKWPL